MDAFFKTQLPANITALVDRIETLANREIAVVIDNRPVSSTSPNPDRLAAEITHTSATILIRSGDEFPPHGVLHELLHIERLWIERIPQVLPKYEKALVNITTAIENTLEHLVIVPREADYGFEPYRYWSETTRRNWSTYPWPAMTDPRARRMSCLLGWLTASHLVDDQAVRRHVEECLSNEGLMDEARRFSARIDEKLVSKPQAISAVLRFLKIPAADFWAVRINIKDNSAEEVPLPLH